MENNNSKNLFSIKSLIFKWVYKFIRFIWEKLKWRKNCWNLNNECKIKRSKLTRLNYSKFISKLTKNIRKY